MKYLSSPLLALDTDVDDDGIYSTFSKEQTILSKSMFQLNDDNDTNLPATDNDEEDQVDPPFPDTLRNSENPDGDETFVTEERESEK